MRSGRPRAARPREHHAAGAPPPLRLAPAACLIAALALLAPPATAVGAATEDAVLFFDGQTSSGFGGGSLHREPPSASEPERVEPLYAVASSGAVWKAQNGVNFTLAGPVVVDLWVEHLDEVVHVGDPTDPATAGLPTFNFTLYTGEGEQGWRVVTLPDRTPGGGPVRLSAEIPLVEGARAVANGSVNLQVVHHGRPIVTTDSSSPLRYLVNSTEFPSSLTFPDVPSDAFRYGAKAAPSVRGPDPEPTGTSGGGGPEEPGNVTGGKGGDSDALAKAAALVAMAIVASLSGWAASRLFRPKRL